MSTSVPPEPSGDEPAPIPLGVYVPWEPSAPQEPSDTDEPNKAAPPAPPLDDPAPPLDVPAPPTPPMLYVPGEQPAPEESTVEEPAPAPTMVDAPSDPSQIPGMLPPSRIPTPAYGQESFGRGPSADAQKSAHKLSTIALVLGICGFFFGLFVSIPAIFVGSAAKKKARRCEAPTGHAHMGLWLGIVSTVFNIFVLVLGVTVGFALLSASSPEVKLGRQAYDAVVDANAYFEKTESYTGWDYKELVRDVPGEKNISGALVSPMFVCVQASDGDTTVHTVAENGGKPRGLKTSSAGSIAPYTWFTGPCTT